MADNLTKLADCKAMLSELQNFRRKFSAKQAGMLADAMSFRLRLAGDDEAEPLYASIVNVISKNGCEVYFALSQIQQTLLTYTKTAFPKNPVSAEPIPVGTPQEVAAPPVMDQRKLEPTYIQDWENLGKNLTVGALAEEQLAEQLINAYASFLVRINATNHAGLQTLKIHFNTIKKKTGEFRRSAASATKRCKENANQIRINNGINPQQA